jgi:transcriptional regulator with XRE-family HTH domain
MLEATDVNTRLAGRVRELRAARGLTLEALASRSAVSRSMISLIERGSASPTAVVLDKLATGLGVPLASLFEEHAGAAPPNPVVRRDEQLQWRDPASGYRRRNLSPPRWESALQLVEVEFPACARVALETAAREIAIDQQVWVLAGSIEVSVGDERHRLGSGDCLAMRLDRPIVFSNPGRGTARYVVALARELHRRSGG